MNTSDDKELWNGDLEVQKINKHDSSSKKNGFSEGGQNRRKQSQSYNRSSSCDRNKRKDALPGHGHDKRSRRRRGHGKKTILQLMPMNKKNLVEFACIFY